jgi:hypothetical protein
MQAMTNVSTTNGRKKQAGARPGAALDAGGADAIAVVGAVNIFVGDDDGVRGEELASWTVRRQIPRRLRGCGGLVHAEEAEKPFSGGSGY